MKLHLLRHCKTETMTPTGKDFDRKLLPKGVAQSKLLAEFFNKVHRHINGEDVTLEDIIVN